MQYVFLVFLLLLPVAGGADERPTQGLIYNTKEMSSITYHCDLIRDGLLKCGFVQTAIRKKAKEEGLANILKRARDEC